RETITQNTKGCCITYIGQYAGCTNPQVSCGPSICIWIQAHACRVIFGRCVEALDCTTNHGPNAMRHAQAFCNPCGLASGTFQESWCTCTTATGPRCCG